MIVDVNTKAVCQISIEPEEAFRILCKTLYMDAVLDEDTDYFVVRNDFGDCQVCYTRDGHDEVYDSERGELFVALRKVAVELFPNTSFRTAEYYKTDASF